MNVFYLDKSPKTSAAFLINSHVSKMIGESGQILSNCYTLERLEEAPLTQIGNYRKHSYPYHPCCKWVQEAEDNFHWLVDHATYMYEEKLYRTGKGHFSYSFIEWCRHNVPEFDKVEMTTPALAMNDYSHLKSDDAVESYRKFYVADKQIDKNGKRIDVWTKRERPDFWYDYVDLASFPDYLK